MTHADQLLRVFGQKKPDGSFVHSKQSVEHILPLLVMPAFTSESSEDKADQQSCLAAGLSWLVGLIPELNGATADEAQRYIARFYQTHPPDPILLKAIQKCLRESILLASSGGPSETARSLLGQLSHVVMGRSPQTHAQDPRLVAARFDEAHAQEVTASDKQQTGKTLNAHKKGNDYEN